MMRVETALFHILEGGTEIDLSYASIRHDESILVEDLKQNKTVRKLNLYRNEITSQGAREIAQLIRVNSTLKVIYLGWNLFWSSWSARNH